MSLIKNAGDEFIDFSKARKKSHHCIILRHDIDADLSAALKMAKLEGKLSIKSTYFLMLRSPLYNLMARENHNAVCEILDNGHFIGLHYDQGFDVQRGWTLKETQKAIEDEISWLELQFGSVVNAISFHQPGNAVLNNKIDIKDRINTYDNNMLAEFEYVSDSNRSFSLSNLIGTNVDFVKNNLPRKLQLLIHPMWWVYDDLRTDEVWNRVISANFDIAQRQLLLTERAYGNSRKILINNSED